MQKIPRYFNHLKAPFRPVGKREGGIWIKEKSVAARNSKKKNAGADLGKRGVFDAILRSSQHTSAAIKHVSAAVFETGRTKSPAPARISTLLGSTSRITAKIFINTAFSSRS